MFIKARLIISLKLYHYLGVDKGEGVKANGDKREGGQKSAVYRWHTFWMAPYLYIYKHSSYHYNFLDIFNSFVKYALYSIFV